MDKNKNLYKLDDFFLIISYLLILPLLYIFWPMIKYAASNPEAIREILLQFVQSQPVLVTILAGSIIFLQILGRLIRKEEKILVKILDIVVMYKTISINQLQHSLDMNQPQIEKYIKKLSNIGHLNINYDGTYVKLELAAQSIPSFDSFQQADNSTDAIYRVSSGQAPVSDFRSSEKESTPEFQPILPAKELSSNLHNLNDADTNTIHHVSPSSTNTISSKEDLQNILMKLQGSHQGKQTSGKKFNVALFIVLFFAFWPIAFIYAASYYMKSQKGNVIEERLKNRLKDM